MITIVDYGMGNLGSVLNMFKKIGSDAKISSNINEISDSTKILLPGVGAFDAAISKIKERGFLEVLNEKALNDKIPILGICLGMQLMTESSEEGVLPGLGWIKGHAKKFSSEVPDLKIPHMGWNFISPKLESPILDGLNTMSKFYFVHSYYVETNLPQHVLATTDYCLNFHSMITNGNNIFGAQFHPEKSHKYGMKLFQNFAEL